MGFGAFAYYCSGGCVIVKVFVMAEAVVKVKRTKRVAMSRSILGFRLNRERGSRLGKERKKKKFNMQNDVIFLLFFPRVIPIRQKSHLIPCMACLHGQLTTTYADNDFGLTVGT